MNKETREKIYQAMDSFLVESTDLDNKPIFRSVDRLNQDRHLFMEQMYKIIQEAITQERERIAQEVIELLTVDITNTEFVEGGKKKRDKYMFFKKKEKKPRIAYREQRDGTKIYFVETWQCYPNGCFYSQNSKETTNLGEARKMLKQLSEREIVKTLLLKEADLGEYEDLRREVERFL